MTTMTMTSGGIEERLRAHYAAVRARLRAPHNHPPKNRLKEVLAAAERRAAELAAHADKIRQEREATEREARKLLHQEQNERWMKRYREKGPYPGVFKARERAKERSRAATAALREREATRAQLAAQGNPWTLCPFDPVKSPALHAAVAVIMDHFQVTWLELISRGRDHHLLTAKAVLYNLLSDVGFTWHGIAKVTDHNVGNYHARAKQFAARWRAKAVTNACFANAMACVKDISPAELAVWKVKNSPLLANTETSEK